MDNCFLFENIKRLYTFEGFQKKDGRRVDKEDWGCVRDAALFVKDGRIAWLGPRRQWKKTSAKIVDCCGLKMIPAFVECHTHSIFAGERSDEFERRNQGESYESIAASGGGILKTVKSTKEASLETLQKLAQKRIDEFVRQGVTCVEVKSGYGLNPEMERKMLKVATALKRAEIVRTFLGPHALLPEQTEDQVRLLYSNEYLREIYHSGLAERVDIFVEKGFFSKKFALDFLTRAKNIGFSLSIHADQLSLSGGTDLGLSLGAASVDHLVHLTEVEIRKLAASETVAVALPLADFYLDIDYPRAREILDLGGNLALATDFNPGSAPSQDLALTGLLARKKMKLSLAEVFCAYTYSASKALRRSDRMGVLIPGYEANFQLFDGSLEDFFYSVGSSPTQTVYRGGLCLVS